MSKRRHRQLTDERGHIIPANGTTVRTRTGKLRSFDDWTTEARAEWKKAKQNGQLDAFEEASATANRSRLA